MSAYMSRGHGVLVKLRVEHRLSLGELALILCASDEETGEELLVATIRDTIARALRESGTDVMTAAVDGRREAEDDDERMAWCRTSVARAYRRDFARFPAELAAFETGGDSA